jgi:cytochrome c oxidase assembly protein subunit 15
MAQNSTSPHPPIAAWHRNLLAAAAVVIILLIAMGGVLCATHSIRTCPDWPGCFGKIIPPLEISPILEYTHRLLAALGGLLILGSAIAGLARAPRLRWISWPPLAAIPLLILVSFFGARVVLHGLSPGWAAVDLGAALLVGALLVTAAVVARARGARPDLPDRLSFQSPFARLALITLGLVYLIFVTGVLVSGTDSITACLSWPIYSPSLFRLDGHPAGAALRMAVSVVGVGMLALVWLQARGRRERRPGVYRAARRAGAVFLLEAVLQALLLVFGLTVYLRVAYTVTAGAFWGLLVAFVVTVGLEED